MVADLNTLVSVVQRNCHIADARYGGNYSMCVYLLKMREYFRWERGMPLGENLPHEEVGEWLEQRERLWEELQDQPFDPISVADHVFDPFDHSSINTILEESNLIYSGGLGEGVKPHFFLADLERKQVHEHYQVLISGKEHARDLAAPPAMLSDNTIFIRRESLRRMVWERVENWRWHKADNAMGRALQHYGLDRDLHHGLNRMTDDELENVRLHEVGEFEAGRLLGGEWNEMLADMPRSRGEIMARAVRDHLADCVSTLPTLVEQQHAPSIHLYFANLNSMRKEIFPGLEHSYRSWIASNNLQPLEEIAARGREHWLSVAKGMLSLRVEHGKQYLPKVEALVEQCRL